MDHRCPQSPLLSADDVVEAAADEPRVLLEEDVVDEPSNGRSVRRTPLARIHPPDKAVRWVEAGPLLALGRRHLVGVRAADLHALVRDRINDQPDATDVDDAEARERQQSRHLVDRELESVLGSDIAEMLSHRPVGRVDREKTLVLKNATRLENEARQTVGRNVLDVLARKRQIDALVGDRFHALDRVGDPFDIRRRPSGLGL